MKKCVVISDSFKGTLSSVQICEIAKKAIKAVFPQCEAVALPVADGGEGTAECFISALGAEKKSATVSGPYGEKITAFYARYNDTAVIEMAAAAGLPMVGENKNPEKTTTFGVGEMIADAVKCGAKRILLGLGGTCTNDGGCGCCAALGVKFFDENGETFVPTGETLSKIAKIDTKNAEKLLKNVQISAMCDVTNPFFGRDGAAFIFAPQKGADDAAVLRLDNGLRALDRVFDANLGVKCENMPGAGAAGGTGGGIAAMLKARLCPGIEAVLDTLCFDERIKGADLIITGEGRVDSKSVCGKVISGVCARAQKQKIPVIAIAGSVAPDADSVYQKGIAAVFGTDREAKGFPKCAENAAENYEKTLLDVLRLIKTSESFRKS